MFRRAFFQYLGTPLSQIPQVSDLDFTMDERVLFLPYSDKDSKGQDQPGLTETFENHASSTVFSRLRRHPTLLLLSLGSLALLWTWSTNRQSPELAGGALLSKAHRQQQGCGLASPNTTSRIVPENLWLVEGFEQINCGGTGEDEKADAGTEPCWPSTFEESDIDWLRFRTDAAAGGPALELCWYQTNKCTGQPSRGGSGCYDIRGPINFPLSFQVILATGQC